MKKWIKSFVCVFLSAVMILLFGCEKTDTPQTTTDTDSETTAPEKPGEVYVFDDGIKEDDGQGGAETFEPQSYSYSQDFEKKITASDEDWFVNSEGTQKDGVFSSKSNHAYLANKHKIKADVFVAEWDYNEKLGGNIYTVT